MRVLFDTNVVLDVLIDRAPFADRAARLLTGVEHGAFVGYVGATTITTVHYLARKALGRIVGAEAVGRLLALLEVAPVNCTVLTDGLPATSGHRAK